MENLYRLASEVIGHRDSTFACDLSLLDARERTQAIFESAQTASDLNTRIQSQYVLLGFTARYTDNR
jgi:hypothetical protein